MLTGSGDKPADLLLSEGLILLDGKKIPCIQVGNQNIPWRVIVIDDVCVPERSEAVVDVYVERSNLDDLDKCET